MLTPFQIQELASIMERTHLVFLGSELGASVLTPNDISVLQRHGIDVNLLPKYGKADISFRFGLLAESLGKSNANLLSYKQIKKFVQEERYIPLSEHQKFALEAVKRHAYSDIKGLESKIVRDINNISIERSRKSRAKYENIIQRSATEAVRKSQTVSQLASEIGHKTKDWARDLDRISDYVLHEAFDSGKAMSVFNREGESGLVYKEVYAGACLHCQKAYLTNGIGSKPIIFKVGKLIGNGSNVGRKTKDWLPCIGPLHPWCRCELVHIPPNHDWDEASRSFKPVRRESKIQRKSKVRITIT